MPSRATLDAFIAMVESNQHDRAIAEFYAEDATMQENLTQPPRQGRDVLVAHEQAVLARAKTVQTECVRPVLVDGDTVVIHWIFLFEFRDGSKKTYRGGYVPAGVDHEVAKQIGIAGPVELTVDTPETTQLINMESIQPNMIDAYFAGIILTALELITD
ncbi:MAG: nuclear transport factor 2 family protein [Ferrovibrio sp.]